MKLTMLIVGLGLIGGSLALALKGFEDFEMCGVDVSQPTPSLYAAEASECGRPCDRGRRRRAPPGRRGGPRPSTPRGSWTSWPGIGMRSSRGPCVGRVRRQDRYFGGGPSVLPALVQGDFFGAATPNGRASECFRALELSPFAEMFPGTPTSCLVSTGMTQQAGAHCPAGAAGGLYRLQGRMPHHRPGPRPPDRLHQPDDAPYRRVGCA